MAVLYGTSLVQTDNISLSDFDAEPLVFDGAYHSASATFDGVTYVYIADRTSDAIRVYTLSEAGELDDVATINDTGGITLGGANRLVVFEVGGNPFLAVTGDTDNGITTFALTGSAPYLTFADRAFDSDNPDTNLGSASGIVAFKPFFSGMHLYVAGESSNGISVFEVDSSGG